MNWEQKKSKSRRQRRRHSKNAYRKWKKSVLAAADLVVLELVQLAEKSSENTSPSDG